MFHKLTYNYIIFFLSEDDLGILIDQFKKTVYFLTGLCNLLTCPKLFKSEITFFVHNFVLDYITIAKVPNCLIVKYYNELLFSMAASIFSFSSAKNLQNRIARKLFGRFGMKDV